MKNLINYLSKKSLSLGNGSGMTRKRLGNDSGMTRLCLVSLICLCMLTVGVGNAWGADSGLTASPGVFVIDFYNSNKLTSTSGTTLSLANCTTHVKVPTGIAANNVVTAVSNSGTVQFDKNGGLTFGSGTAGKSQTTLTIGANFPIRKIVAVGTLYGSDNAPLYVAGTSITLNAKQSTYANCSSSTSINPNFITSLVIKQNDGSTNKKRSTLYTAVCEYGYRAYLTTPAEGAIAATPKTANENGAGWNSDTVAVVGLKSGQKVTLSVTSSPSGKVFSSWTIKKKSDNTDITASVLAGNELTMPAYDVKVSVNWASSGTSVSLTKAGETKGTISLSPAGPLTTTSSSASTTVTASPSAGYYLSNLTASNPSTGTATVTGSGNTRTVTYSSGANGSSTITATFSCITPTITADPSNGTCAQGASPTPLTVTATQATGTMSYQWKECSTSGGTYVNVTGGSGGTTASYTPPTSSVGTMYYKCVVTNASSGCSTSATSNYASFEVTASSTWKFKYSGDDYTAHTMTEAAGVASYSLDLAADTRYEFGFDDNGSAFYKNQGTIITTTSGWVFNTSDNNCKIHTGPAGTYTFAINTTTKAVTVTYPTVSHPNDHYVYFKNTDSWGTVKGYLGNTGNDNKAAAWPGSDMQVTTEICGENYYYAALNAMSGTYNVIVFNNGSGSQTSDLSTTGSLGKFNANQDANWHDFKYSITFAGNGNTSGSMSDVSNICIGSDQTLASNGFTKTNYNFTGWTANVDVKIGGSTVTAGTLIANAATIQDIQSNITLTAQWVHVPEITASETARAFGDRKVNGGPYNMTFNVSGQYLTGNISLAITGTNAGMFSVNKTSLTPSTGTVATTEITVSYSPTGAGSHTATLTISSDGATSKTVALTGTGKWEVTWSVNGGETTSLVANGTKPTLPSPAPSSCDATSTTFMGWATSSWAGKLDDVSDKTIHTSNSTMDNVTANGTTFYAVFAKSSGGGGAAVNTTLWAEDFSGWDDGDVPSGNYTNSHTGTTVYGGATVTYSCVNGGSNTKLYGGNNTLYAGGVKPELLVGKNTGTFTVSGIPDGGASEITVSYKQNNKELTVTASETGYSGSATNTPASAATESFDVTVSSGAGGTFTLTFAATSSDNIRMDDILVKVKTQGVSYSEYLTTCVACTSDPDMTSAASALKGVFSSSSVGVTATDWSTGSAYCSWADYGFVWGTSANPTVSDTKVQVGTSGSVTTWDGNLTGSFAVNTTYHYRAYGKNSKDGATIQYSSDQTFTPRNVTFNLNGHGESAPSTQFVNNGSKATDPSYSEVVTGWAFGGWYKEAGCTNAWNFASDVVSGESKTLYAKWTEKPKYTVTLDAGNGTISDANWTNTSGSTYTRTQANGDEEITLPTPACNCAGWVFQGWSTTSKDNAASFTPDKADGASFAPTSNVTYYAVYRQSTQTGTTYTKITTAGEFTTGDYAIVAYSSSLSNYYAMGNSTSSSHMTETTAAADSWTNSTANYIWTVIKVGDYVAFYNADAGKFLTIVDGAWELATDGQKFSYSFNSTTKAWTFTAPSGKQMIYSSYFYVGDAQNNDIYLYKRGSAASGNYYTSPSCSDYSVTGVASPAAGGTVYLTATAAKNGDDIWATYTSDEDYNFTRWEVSGTGASITSTTAEFTKLTVGAGNATVTAVFTAKDWKTVTWKANGVALTGGDLGSASVKVENGHSITNLPPDPTSCETGSGKSDVFMGWSTTEWSGYKNDDEFPDGTVIYASAAAMPTVTDNVTYYACWAQTGSTPTSYTLDFAISSSVGSATAFTAFKTGLTNAATNNTYWDADNITTTNVVYQDAGAAGQVGPRLGSGSNTGTITMPLLTAGQVAPTSITVSAKRYSSDASSKLTLTVYYTDDTNESKDLPSGASSYLTADFDDYTANFTSGKTINKIVIQTKTSGQRAYIASITVTANAMEKYLTKCCDDPELAFTYTGVATAEELVRENKARLDAADEVVLTYTTSSSGTITDPTTASVYKLTTGGDGSGYGSRSTAGGSSASAQVGAISIDKTAKEITLSIKTTSSGGNTGCGTYRVELYQAAYSSGGESYCEKTAYGFVDVKIKYEFIDAVNGNTTVVKYNTGSGVTFPTAGELSGGSDCHSETRVLKGWISETKLTSLYGGSAERVITLDDVKDAADTIIAPGADGKGIYAQGTKWYAVWAYEK